MSVELDDEKLQQLIATAPDELDDWLDGIAYTILGDIVESFGSGPGGETYARGRKVHVASSPGYPPNVDIGALSASMHVVSRGKLHKEIRDGVEYGIYLEEGTHDIQPRPFVGPVFEDWRKKIARDLESQDFWK